MLNYSKLILAVIASVMTLVSGPVHAATGACELIEGTKISTSIFSIFDSSANYSGGRRTYGSYFSSALDSDSETNGHMSQSIVLRDDLGHFHTLSGNLDVSQVYMMKLPDGTSYACLSLAVDDDVPGFAFRISSGADIIDTPVDATTSGRGYGLRVLGQGETETHTQGVEIVFGITDKNGKVIGHFTLVR